MKKPMNKAQCKICKSIIESFHVHDFKTCDCGAISVDGGSEYFRFSGDSDSIISLCGYKHFIRLNTDDNDFFKDIICKKNKWDCDACELDKSICDNIKYITVVMEEITNEE